MLGRDGCSIVGGSQILCRDRLISEVVLLLNVQEMVKLYCLIFNMGKGNSKAWKCKSPGAVRHIDPSS